MVNFWFKRIKGDETRLNEVPELWREKVAEKIKAAKVSAKD